jgi:hypothetical protein
MSREEEVISLYKEYEKLKQEMEKLDKSDPFYKEVTIIEKLFSNYQDIIRDYKISKIL